MTGPARWTGSELGQRAAWAVQKVPVGIGRGRGCGWRMKKGPLVPTLRGRFQAGLASVVPAAVNEQGIREAKLIDGCGCRRLLLRAFRLGGGDGARGSPC